jgi:hypothetical protein
MAIQQLDLGSVFNTLAQQRALGIQERAAQTSERMNALQMARYQREDDTALKQQNALARLNDPSLDETGRRSILGEAFPELLAKQAFREGSFAIGPDGTVINEATGEVVRSPQILDGEAPQAAPQQPRPTLAPGGRGPVPMPVPREELPTQRPYSEGVKSVENTTGNPAAKNPNSSATGDGQFIESTWLDLMNRHAPGLVQGKSRKEILEMREEAELSAKMTDIFGQENRAVLERNGIQATPALIYGAHHFGAGAAVKFAKAPPETSMIDILGADAIRSNPHLAKMTVGQARDAFEKKFAGFAMPGEQPQAAPQQAPQQTDEATQQSDDGFSRVRNLKSAGISQDAPPGMMWVGRRRPDGGIDTKVVPMPGAPDDRADKRANENFEQESKLRTEHQKAVGTFEIAQTNYATMPELAADDSGGSDIALVNAFYKTFAPDSNVQEGEFAIAGKAAGLPDRIVGLFDRALTGQVLNDTQRQELITAAGRFYNQRKAAVEGANERFTKLAKSYPGVNADRVVINPIRDMPKYEPKPKAETEPKKEPKRQDVPEARMAADGKWYVADPARPGKYLEVQ